MKNNTEIPKLIMTDSVMTAIRDVVEMASERSYFKVETGVTLFGVREEGSRVALFAVGPGPEGIHRSTFYQPDTQYLNRRYKELKRELPRLEWIGSLHVHPPFMRWLSDHDKRTVRELLSNEALELPDFMAGILQGGGSNLEISPYFVNPADLKPRLMKLEVIPDDDPMMMQARLKAGEKPMPVEIEIVNRVFARNPAEREHLAGKHLVIVGLGSVGSAIAMMAARAGVGKFTLVDLDRISPENLGRHMCDLTAIDVPKTQAVADLIRRINPTASVDIRAEDFREVVDGILGSHLDPENTVIVAATDSFECQSLVNLHSLDRGIPALYVGCWGEARVGEILHVVPGKTACFECYAGFRRDTASLDRDDPRRYTELDFDTTRVPAQAGLWPNILIICGFAFQILLALFSGGDHSESQVLDCEHPLWLVNVADFSSPLRPMAVNPAIVKRGCPVCDESCLSQLTLEAV